jgi:predicted MFS family arabinose efflux permease
MSEALAPLGRGPAGAARDGFRAVTGAYRAAFSGLPRPVWLLFAVTLVNRAGTMVLPFLALYLTERRGFTPAGAGALLGLYGVGAIAGSYTGGWLSDRLGALRVMGGSLVLGGIGFLVLGVLHSRPAIAAAILALSIVGEAFRPAVSTAIVGAAPRELRTRAYALLRLAVNLGMTIGPVAAGFLAQRDYLWLFVGDGGTCLAAAALLWASFRADIGAPAAAEHEGAAGGSPWRDRPFLALVLLSTLLSIVFFQLLSTYPLTLRTLHGLSEAQVGITFGINTLIIVVVEMVLVQALRDRPPLRVAGVGALLIGLGFGLLPVGRGFGFVAFTLLIWTAGEMLTLPQLQGAAAARAHGRAAGRYMGLFTLAFAISFAVAPILGTWIYQRWGPAAVWYGSGAAGVALWGGFELLDRRLRRAAVRRVPSPGSEGVSAGP